MTSTMEAQRLGTLALGSLIATSLKQGFGIMFQPARSPPVITNYGLQYALEMFPDADTLYRDHLGLMIFEERGDTRFVDMGALGILVTSRLDSFVDTWDQATPAFPSLRKLIAYDLYASSRFEQSARARFLLLVMAVEAMAEQTSRRDEELAIVRGLIASVRASHITEAAKDALVGGLSNLTRISVGRACTQLIESGLAAGVVPDTGAAAFFRDCYRLRGKIVHAGTTPDVSKLVQFANKLEPLIRGLLAWKLQIDGQDNDSLWESTFASVMTMSVAAQRH